MIFYDKYLIKMYVQFVVVFPHGTLLGHFRGSTSNAIQVHFHTKEEAEVFWVGSAGCSALSRRMSQLVTL